MIRPVVRSCCKAILAAGLSAVVWNPAHAEQLLQPDCGVLADSDPAYHLKIADILGRAKDGAAFSIYTVLSAYILASFEVEELVGIRRLEKDKGCEVFRLAASSSIWTTYFHATYSKPAAKRSDRPSPYAKIKALQTTKTIPQEMVDRIEKLWQKHLLEARHPPPSESISLDGVTYQFQMRIKGIGTVSAQTWSPAESPAKEMSELAEALSAYARGKIDLATLEVAVSALEKTKGA